MQTVSCYSLIKLIIFCHNFQILLRISIENQISISCWVVIHQIVKLCRSYKLSATSSSTAVQSIEIILPSVNFSSTQAVSMLNTQLIIFFIFSTSLYFLFIALFLFFGLCALFSALYAQYSYGGFPEQIA